MMIKILTVMTLVLLLLAGCVPSKANSSTDSAPTANSTPAQNISLPAPRLTGDLPLEESLSQRRSVREYSPEPLSLEDVSQLLWAAQGITSDNGLRTAPSAGALYPLEIFLAAGNVTGLAPGAYRYIPEGHQLAITRDTDIREALSQAAVGQASVRNAAAVFVIAGVYSRTTQKYGDRGRMYVHIEVGHSGQNICLQAMALNLGAVPVGAFDDNRVKELLGMEEDESPLYIIPVGHK